MTTRSEATQAARPLDRSVMRDLTSLEEMLVALAVYGKPRISHTGSGWHCNVEMYVSAMGVDFKVASDFGLGAPLIAARQCADRLDKALRDIGA